MFTACSFLNSIVPSELNSILPARTWSNLPEEAVLPEVSKSSTSSTCAPTCRFASTCKDSACAVGEGLSTACGMKADLGRAIFLLNKSTCVPLNCSISRANERGPCKESGSFMDELGMPTRVEFETKARNCSFSVILWHTKAIMSGLALLIS